jgi:predicted TIM-barrel fold metal-dependent hydrolase
VPDELGENGMQIVDAQVHLWSSGTPSGQHRETSIFTAEELLREMAGAGVDAAVIHPPSWDPTPTRWLLRLSGAIRTGSRSWASFHTASRTSAAD